MDTPKNNEQILEAALLRFGHYGFSKTTMAEIARDCDMSAANIYRHFSGKNEILAVLAGRIFERHEAKLAAVCQRPFPSFSLKLHAFFQEAILLTHQYVTEQPKMKEMVDFISLERLDLINSHSEAKYRLIREILAEGADSGEFHISDLAETADAMKKATVMYHTPFFFDTVPLAELQASCRNVVDLLLNGITNKQKRADAEN